MDLSRRSGEDVRTRTMKPLYALSAENTPCHLSLTPIIQHFHSYNNQHSDITDHRTCWDTSQWLKTGRWGFTWLSWFFNQVSSMFYGRHKQTQTHKVLRKCMNEANVYWMCVPRKVTQINTVTAHKRWRMKEEKGVKKSSLSLSMLSVFDHWSLTLKRPDNFLLWIAQATGMFSYRRIKTKFCDCLCIFSNYKTTYLNNN